MKKRTFLQAMLASGSVGLLTARYLQPPKSALPLQPPVLPEAPQPSILPEFADTTPQEEFELVMLQENELHPGFRHNEREPETPQQIEEIVEQLPEETVDSYLEKIRNFDANFRSDIYLSEANSLLLLPTVARLERVQNFVGHANFNLLGFDEMLYFARNYAEIGAFEKAELDFMEEVFYADATTYGFFGDKITPELNHRISSRDVEKINGSGHYLLKGESLDQYNQIRRDVGTQLLLTSGIRNNVKQMHLFLAKAFQSDGNLSKASRSLAPPGHSYHNSGDFDVGKIGLGAMNFTADFSHTPEFERLISLGYVDIRYTDTNQFGVRYEPWHIKLGCKSEHGSSCDHTHA
jgi:D-alanyl-D-alanine carboxypeptidase